MVSIFDDANGISRDHSDDYGDKLKSLSDLSRTIDDRNFVFGSGSDASKFAMISLERTSQGLGFNIVGGKDSQHIPGHSGIFVSIIKSDGPAYNDGRLSVGDLILSINGIDLVNKTHDEAVSIFRSQDQPINDLLVEIGAENRILNEQFSADTHISAVKTPIDEDAALFSGSSTPILRRSEGFGRPSSCADDARRQEEDAESTASFAPSTHSYLDDVPRTPKRPMSYLDPRNPSLVTEVLYVSIGLAVISLGAFVVYRVVRGRR